MRHHSRICFNIGPEKENKLKKEKVKITGKATCRFVCTMEVYEDEVAGLLSDEDMQANNLDHPDAAFDIESWVETEAIILTT
jgi:hypothetical protein